MVSNVEAMEDGILERARKHGAPAVFLPTKGPSRLLTEQNV